jgi:A/G-specific adenine glycosylase
MNKIFQQTVFVKRLLLWARNNYRQFEWRDNRDPYRVFVAETLLRRTTSKAADRIFYEFIERYPSVRDLARTEPEELANYIKPIGLYQQRSKAFVQAAYFLDQHYNGEFPVTLNELLDIPHIGEYAARCILSFGLGKPVPIVDSNVQRVISRVFEETVGSRPSLSRVTIFLSGMVPKKSHVSFNYGLIDFGSLVCTYRSCGGINCPMRAICDYVRE